VRNTFKAKGSVYDGGTPPFPTFDVYRGAEDKCVVVHVETTGIPENEKGPILRVYLNDEPIYENPPCDKE